MRRSFELKDISWLLFTFDFLKGLHDFGSLLLMRVIIKSFIQIIHGSIGLQQVNTNFYLFRNPYTICISNCLTFNLTCVLWHIEFVKLDYISLDWVFNLHVKWPTWYSFLGSVSIEFSIYPEVSRSRFWLGFQKFTLHFMRLLTRFSQMKANFLAIISSVFFSVHLLTCLSLCLGLPQNVISYTSPYMYIKHL